MPKPLAQSLFQPLALFQNLQEIKHADPPLHTRDTRPSRSFTALPMAALAPSSGPTSTVVYVSGDDLVLKASDGKILNYIVPASYKFSTGGKQVVLADLTPGATLTAPVATGSDPLLVASITTMKAKVYATTPPDVLTLTTPMGAKDFTVPDGTKFVVGGKALAYADLASDVTLDITVITPRGPKASILLRLRRRRCRARC